MTGMCALTTIEELVIAVSKALGENVTSQIEVQSMRKTTTGKSSTTIKIPIELANKHIEMRSFKVLYNICYVRERVSIPRCHRCQDANHLEANCGGPDRKHLCIICGKNVHENTLCDEKPKCFTYQEAADHRTCSMACPVFRRIINKGNKTKLYRRRQSTTTSEHE